MNQTQVDILRLLKSEPASPAQLLNAIGIPAVTASVDIRQLSDLGFIRRVSSSSGYLYLITKTGKHALYYAAQEAEALEKAERKADTYNRVSIRVGVVGIYVSVALSLLQICLDYSAVLCSFFSRLFS